MSRPSPPHADPRPAPLWLLPLVAGALPLIGTVVAFQLAVAQGQFPACNPLLDGCVSISRAARYDLPNHLFRALLLPAAALQGIVWLLAAAWVVRLGAPRDRLLRLLPWVGLTAAAFLVLYGTFLGTEGHGYRLMRRYGVFVYFGFTCISMLIVAGAVQQASRLDGPLRGALRRVAVVLFALTAALPLLGIAHVLSPLVLDSEAARDAFGNVTEWWGGAIFTAFFFLLAWLWRQTSYGAALRLGDG